MKIDDIENIFRNRKGQIIGKHRKSAVMLLMCEEDGELCVIFEVRSYSMRSQPGDICLPGGRMEEGESPLMTAVRETKEELNLKDEDIEVLGEMDYFVSPYGSIIYPFTGLMKKSSLEPNKEEVDHVFKVPLSFFMNTEPLSYEMAIGPKLTDDFPYHLVRGGRDYKFSRGTLNQYFYKYGEYVIWGFTAMIIKAFVDIVKCNKEFPQV